MLDKLKSVQPFIGNTPLRKLFVEGLHVDLYAKLEFGNFAGSIKSRPAFHILNKAIESGVIDQHSTIVESSSGNFAIALAMFSKLLGIDFIPVIDPNINPGYEQLLRYLCRKVIKVTRQDETGGYLLTRLAVVHELCETHKNVFWPNQYENKYNAQAYYQFMGKEIADSFDQLDYAFIGVSSCGTIAGLSKRLKEEFPGIKIIAIDVEGSVIFMQKPRKRFISGIGSSIVPPLVNHAEIDEIIHLPQTDIIEGCHELVDEHMLFAGASSGASYSAVKKYFKEHPPTGDAPKVVFICPDRGDAYLDTIYNQEWGKVVADAQSLQYSL
jgi:cysteine synthase A